MEISTTTPEEKVRLIGELLSGICTNEDEARINTILRRSTPEHGARIIQGLAGEGRLNELVDDVHGAEYQRLLGHLPRCGATRESAGLLAAALGRVNRRDNQLAIHRIFDTARSRGFLPQLLDDIGNEQAHNALLVELASQAKPTRRPLIIAHRGVPGEYVENTLASLEAALERGADGLEIDVTVTSDSEIVLWHDYDPGTLVALVRNLGLEPGMRARPAFPELLSDERRPVYEHTLESFRASFGYWDSSGPLGVEIPLLDEVLAWAQSESRIRLILLDAKLPPGEHEVQARFARRLKRLVDGSKLAGKCAAMSTSAEVIQNLVAEMGEGYRFIHDVEFDPDILHSADDVQPVAAADALGLADCALGLPRVGLRGEAAFLEALARDRAELDRVATPERPRRLIAWTINDELRQRKCVAIGVDAILTDYPARLARTLDKLGLGEA